MRTPCSSIQSQHHVTPLTPLTHYAHGLLLSNRLRGQVCSLSQQHCLPVAPFVVHQCHRFVPVTRILSSFAAYSAPESPPTSFTPGRLTTGASGSEKPLFFSQENSCAKSAPALPDRFDITSFGTRPVVLCFKCECIS